MLISLSHNVTSCSTLPLPSISLDLNTKVARQDRLFDGILCFHSSWESPGSEGSIKVSALPFNPLSHTSSSTIRSKSAQFIHYINSLWSIHTRQHKQKRTLLIYCQVHPLTHKFPVLTKSLSTQTMKHHILHAALLPSRAEGALPVLAEGSPHGNSRRVCACFRFPKDAVYVPLLPSKGSPPPLLWTAWHQLASPPLC